MVRKISASFEMLGLSGVVWYLALRSLGQSHIAFACESFIKKVVRVFGLLLARRRHLLSPGTVSPEKGSLSRAPDGKTSKKK